MNKGKSPSGVGANGVSAKRVENIAKPDKKVKNKRPIINS